MLGCCLGVHCWPLAGILTTYPMGSMISSDTGVSGRECTCFPKQNDQNLWFQGPRFYRHSLEALMVTSDQQNCDFFLEVSYEPSLPAYLDVHPSY
jgi:hypothetical protein